jgi:hypothetical protein
MIRDVVEGQSLNSSQAGTLLFVKGSDSKAHAVSADTGGNLSLSSLPAGTPVSASSGNVANGAAVATLAGVAGKTTYITGFEVTASGATLGLPVTVTVAGLLGGTLSYTFAFIAGALLASTPLIVQYPQPLPASAANTAIVVTLPAGGTGATNATANAHGFQL